jgi:type IV secretory pathway VirB2 component (pilin)
MELPQTHLSKSNVFYYLILSLMSVWNVICTIILVVLQSLKLYNFPVPRAAGDFSMCAPFLWFLDNLCKIWAGNAANRAEHVVVMIVCMVLTLGSILFEVYFLVWQPYVWAWESPLHIISICLDGIIMLFSALLLIFFICIN